MNLLVEEDYDESRHDYYVRLLKHYYEESYSKFHENPEYLVCVSVFMRVVDWIFLPDWRPDFSRLMINAVEKFSDQNLFVRAMGYIYLPDYFENKGGRQAILCIQKILDTGSDEYAWLKDLGAPGEYF